MEETESKPKVFKVGDKVISKEGRGEGEVKGFEGKYVLVKFPERLSGTFLPDHLWHVLPKEIDLLEPPKYQFKVGDKVKCLHPTIVCDMFKDEVGKVSKVFPAGTIEITYSTDDVQVAYPKDDGVVLVEEAESFTPKAVKTLHPEILYIELIPGPCNIKSFKSGEDSVNHPSHYNESGIECIEAIRASLGPDGFQAYCKGNCMKYLWRYEYKNGLEDLKKAQVYLGWMIDSVEEEEN